MSGLRQTMAALDDVSERLMSSKEVRPRALGTVGRTAEERSERLDRELGEIRRLIREVKADGQHAAEVQQLEAELASLEARARDAASAEGKAASGSAGVGAVAELVGADRLKGMALYAEAEKARAAFIVLLRQTAKEALARFDRRLSRLVRRARLGRIETVLGKKRALEVEMEALSEGFLPQGAVDSLEAARYLRDDEEYWPYEGEDWADEYVGGEGLR
jgi:chromosome segregation ATPase